MMCAGVALSAVASATSHAQAPTVFTMADARAAARRVSPELVAAREAVAAALGREHQANAYPNPTLAVNREQTSGGGQSNSQNIAAFDQPIELPGLRSARRDAAAARRGAVEARVEMIAAQLDFDVTRAYALALAADRRVALAVQASTAFDEALRVSQRRLAEGDVSGYANRRLKLEAARYATLRAEAVLAQRSARVALASLVLPEASDLRARDIGLSDAMTPVRVSFSSDSLLALALRSRAEVRIAALDADAAAADARLTMRERTPMPSLSAGLKTERVSGASGASQGLSGLVAGVSIPFPVWDRRAGAMQAADAEARRRSAEIEVQRRRIVREVADAVDAYRSVEEQIALLVPHLGAEASASLRAVQVAYAEGEITLLEWLDAVRAYRDAEAIHATLQAELIIRRAALERAVGTPTGFDR